MFFTLKKTDIISCLMAVFVALTTYTVVKSGCESIVVSALPFNGKIIVIDAGHGIPDGGAVGISGTIEQSLNLDIALKLQHMLEQSGAYVILTRADENAVAEDLSAKIRDIKRSDLKYRRDMRDNSGCDAFISIHMNKFEQEKYSGAQVFYSASPESSKILGDCIQQKLISVADPQNTRVAKVADSGIFILKNSNVPSAIVECGFLSNIEEEQKLGTEQYREQLAYAIYHGITDYFDAIKTDTE